MFFSLPFTYLISFLAVFLIHSVPATVVSLVFFEYIGDHLCSGWNALLPDTTGLTLLLSLLLNLCSVVSFSMKPTLIITFKIVHLTLQNTFPFHLLFRMYLLPLKILYDLIIFPVSFLLECKLHEGGFFFTVFLQNRA